MSLSRYLSLYPDESIAHPAEALDGFGSPLQLVGEASYVRPVDGLVDLFNASSKTKA